MSINTGGNFMEVKIASSNTEVSEPNMSQGMVGVHQPMNGTYQTGTGEFTPSGITTTTESIRPYKGDVLSTLRTKQGSPVVDVTKITDDHLVKIGNMEVTVAQAKSLGYITGDNKALSETGRTVQDERTEQAETKSAEAVQTVDFTEGSEVFPMLEKLVGRSMLDATQSSIIGHLNRVDHNGQPLTDEAAMAGAAKAMTDRVPNMNTDQASRVIKHMVTTYANNAAKFITEQHGIDGQQVIQWAADNLKPQQKQRIYQALAVGNFHVLNTLAQQAAPYIK